MSNNVIILGAGFSFNAGIPLLGGFVERMWEFATRKTHNGKPLSPEDLDIFEDAMEVKNELDSYHGRAVFDDRNIEDLLSILSFNVLGGGRGDQAKLSRMNRAIAKTIELCCEVKHPGVPKEDEKFSIVEDGPEMYRQFWKALFDRSEDPADFPTIITFNYDLVLERSLLQLMIGTNYNFRGHEKRAPFDMCHLRYYRNNVPDLRLEIEHCDYSGPNFNNISGTKLRRAPNGSWNREMEVELLKLHGSLNFPKSRTKIDPDEYNLAKSLEDPDILPPISNKMSGDMSSEIWRIALQRLREAKNVVVVGYSLPKTDIYMQYFLKAALGPNIDLNKISVFDPVLHSGGAGNNEMRERYQGCFAPQLHPRIDFNPAADIMKDQWKGTAAHFVKTLQSIPGDILF